MSQGLKIADQIVRCPFVFWAIRPLLPRPKGWFICRKCGHPTMLGEPKFKMLQSEMQGVPTIGVTQLEQGNPLELQSGKQINHSGKSATLMARTFVYVV